MILQKNRKERRKDKKAKIESKTVELSLGTLYEANKKLVEQYEPVLTNEQLEEKQELIADFILETKNKYYMMLCHDKKDFTVFTIVSEDDGNMIAAEILIKECLPIRGNTKSIELTENKDAIEIWISIDGESYCYKLFPYDAAIIEC
jgi:hypothetical protein